MKELTKEIAKTLNGKKIKFQATKQIDWFTAKIEGIFKIWVDEDENVWIMKPRATRKGYILRTLDNPMYEPLDK